jgi:ABC-type amino acid transport substrate-binding protein
MERIVVDLQTGTTTTVPFTAEETAQAQADYAAWQAAEAQRVATPSLEQIVAQLQAELAALKG